MLKSHVNDPQRWRDNAAEMRVLAKGMKDVAKRRTMNRLADGWDKLADRAEARCAAGSPNLIADGAHRSAYRRSVHGTSD